MKADTQVIHVGEELALPWDLRAWIEAGTLRAWIGEELDSLDWNNPQVIEYLQQRPGFQPKALLWAITYAYTTAVFESEEIHRNGLSDPAYQAIVGERWRMSADGLTKFRRDNRGLLKWTLVQVFKRAIRAHHGDFMLPAGLKRRLVDAAVARIDLARQMDRGYDEN